MLHLKLEIIRETKRRLKMWSNAIIYIAGLCWGIIGGLMIASWIGEKKEAENA